MNCRWKVRTGAFEIAVLEGVDTVRREPIVSARAMPLPLWSALLLAALFVCAAQVLASLFGFAGLAIVRLPEVLEAARGRPGELLPVSASTGDAKLIGMFAFAAAVAVITPLAGRSLRVENWWGSLGLVRPPRRQLFGWLLAAAALEVVLVLAVNAFTLPEGPVAAQQAFLTTSNVPMLVAGFTLVAPLSEELLFRGVVLAPVAFLPRRSFGVVAAVALSSTLWALGHDRAPLAILLLSIQGVLLSVARLSSGSVWTPCLMHGATNAYTVVALVLEASGTI
jgi:membrane protease YdiL (CAAX protease family)